MLENLKIACVQVKAREYKERDITKDIILKMIDTAGKENARLIVLPEAVYPAYYLSPLFVKDTNEFYQSTLELVEQVKVRAAKYHCYIAIGIVENDVNDKKLYNSALLIDPEGNEISRFRKSFLWHFDSCWFSEGKEYPVVKTDIGNIGLFICADGRLPEIPRCLTLQGADILIDLTNWVTAGLNDENLTNPQAEYMIPVRAQENQTWIIAANKVGMEANSILYCGKSAIFSPQGEIVKMATSFKEEIIFYEISPENLKKSSPDQVIDVIDDRMPELYGELVQPTENTPIYSVMKEKLNEQKHSLLTTVAQIDFGNDFSNDLKKIEFHIKNQIVQDADLIIFPENNVIFQGKGKEMIDRINQLIQNNKMICAITIMEKSGRAYFKTTYLLQSGSIIGKYRKTHLEATEKKVLTAGDLGLPVFKTSFGYIGMMIGYEGFFPEIARTLTLKGADIIIWPSKFNHDQQIKISRSRSAENKIYIACSNSISGEGNGHSLISSPSGTILASCLENVEQSCMSSLYLPLSRNKNIVPHTNAILNRKPESYQILVKKKGE